MHTVQAETAAAAAATSTSPFHSDFVDDYDFGGVMSQCLFNGLLLLLKDRALNCGGGGGSNSNYDSTKHCYEPNYDTRTSESTRALLLLLLVETHNIYCQ